MKHLIISIALISFSVFANAEGNEETKKVMETISFKVVDTNNESIAGAEIEIAGLVSYTDMEGNVKLEIPTNISEKMKISFISYEDKMLEVKDIKEGKVILIEE